jgi:hypothetical protein
MLQSREKVVLSLMMLAGTTTTYCHYYYKGVPILQVLLLHVSSFFDTKPVLSLMMLSDSGLLPVDDTGTQFTCFTGTKLRILTQLPRQMKKTEQIASGMQRLLRS